MVHIFEPTSESALLRHCRGSSHSFKFNLNLNFTSPMLPAAADFQSNHSRLQQLPASGACRLLQQLTLAPSAIVTSQQRSRPQLPSAAAGCRRRQRSVAQ